MAGRAPQNLFAILADLEIGIDIRDRCAFQTCVDQCYILFCCGIPVHLSGICAIHHDKSGCFLRWQMLKVSAKETGVGIDILLILVIHNDRTAIADSFYDICRITDVLLSGLGAEGRLRVCRVLKRCRFR